VPTEAVFDLARQLSDLLAFQVVDYDFSNDTISEPRSIVYTVKAEDQYEHLQAHFTELSASEFTTVGGLAYAGGSN
jgi:hypothetical protein